MDIFALVLPRLEVIYIYGVMAFMDFFCVYGEDIGVEKKKPLVVVLDANSNTPKQCY